MKQTTKIKANPLKILIGKLGECDDHRDPNRLSYSLVEILFLTFCGSVSSCETYEEIVDFGNLKLSWLRKFLPFKNGIPSPDTIGRILAVLNTKQLEKVLSGFCEYMIELPNGSVLNIDGKRISRSATIKEQQTKKSEGGKQAINMVNVYCSMVNSCLASIQVSCKAAEKKALDDILLLLDVSHCLLSFDAGYCYTDVAEQVVEAEADYLIGLKQNQPKLFEVAQDLLTNNPAIQIHEDEQTNGHGRIEQRTCTVLNISDLKKSQPKQYEELFQKWTGLKCLIKVVCQRTIKATNKKSAEPRYYISSKEFDPQYANEIVRGHWGVENNLHWVLDAIFREDKSTKRAGNSAANFSILRKLAFNKLKSYDDPKVSMKRKMKKCAMSEQYLENILGIAS